MSCYFNKTLNDYPQSVLQSTSNYPLPTTDYQLSTTNNYLNSSFSRKCFKKTKGILASLLQFFLYTILKSQERWQSIKYVLYEGRETTKCQYD